MWSKVWNLLFKMQRDLLRIQDLFLTIWWQIIVSEIVTKLHAVSFVEPLLNFPSLIMQWIITLIFQCHYQKSISVANNRDSEFVWKTMHGGITCQIGFFVRRWHPLLNLPLIYRLRCVRPAVRNLANLIWSGQHKTQLIFQWFCGHFHPPIWKTEWTFVRNSCSGIWSELTNRICSTSEGEFRFNENLSVLMIPIG